MASTRRQRDYSGFQSAWGGGLFSAGDERSENFFSPDGYAYHDAYDI